MTTSNLPRASRGAVRYGFLITTSAIGLLASGVAASAQTTAAAPAADAAIDEIIVSGSRVVRDGYEAPTPVTVVGVEQMEQQAVSNIADFVNTLPAFAGSRTSTANVQTSNGMAGINSLSLRDLGPERTLTLFDGQRSVAGSITGAVDINSFPQQLVSRVDVVTGGASAAYGSDALAGVVNFILDKEFTGIKGEVSGGMTNYRDGENYKVSLTGGTPFASGRGHLLLSGEVVRNEGVVTPKNRPWNRKNLGIMNNPNYTPTNGEPRLLLLDPVNDSRAAAGGLITSGPLKGTAFGAGGAPYQFDYGTLNDGSTMYGSSMADALNLHYVQSLGTRESRQSAFLRVAYDVTDNINVFAQWQWGHSNTYNIALTPRFSGNLTLRADNAFIPAETAARMVALGVSQFNMGTLNADLDYEHSPEVMGDRTTVRNVIGATGTLDAFGSDWSWDAYAQIGVTRQTSRLARNLITANYRNAIDAVRDANGTIVCRVNADADPTNDAPGCVPYNMFGTGVNTQEAVNYVLGVNSRNERFQQNVYAVSINGEPFENWAGPVSLALGVEHRVEKVRGFVDESRVAAGGWNVGNYLPTFGKYNVTEGFIETVVPVASEQPWARTLDVNAAARFTGYSTSGFVVTWKAGVTYAPIDDVRFRFTRSRDIRAPNLQELFSAGSTGIATVLDPWNNNFSTFARGGTAGNPNLEPEKADTTGIGVVLQPSFIEGFNAAVDYWNIDLKGGIGSVSAQNLINFCFRGDTQYCSAFERTVVNGEVQITYQSQPYNIAQQIVRGIDFESSYRFGLHRLVDDWNGDVTIRGLATRYLRKYTDNGVNPPTEALGEIQGTSSDGGMPKWRWSATITYDLAPLTATLAARGTSGGTYNNTYIVCTSGCPTSTIDNMTINKNRIDGAVFFDTSFSWAFDNGITAFFNMQNLLNSDPPAAMRNNGTWYGYAQTNPILFDSLGRVYRAGLRFRM